MRKAKGKNLGRNDPCWCGSGKKFKRCHFSREYGKRVQFGEIYNDVLTGRRRKVCLHPDASSDTCGRIIRAHTIQRARVMKRIVNENQEVLSFRPLLIDNDMGGELARTGWRVASTFYCFCSKHDHELFLEIDGTPFVGSKEQCFLHGYRALNHELYKKQCIGQSEEIIRRKIDRGRPVEQQHAIQATMAVYFAGIKASLADLRETKKIYDASFNRHCESMNGFVIEYEGDITVASSGIVHVEYDFKDDKIQDIVNSPIPTQSISYSIAATESGGAFVAAWPKQFALTDDFVQSLIDQDVNDIPSLLLEFMFAYVENSFFF